MLLLALVLSVATVSLRKNNEFFSVNQSWLMGAAGVLKFVRVAKYDSPTWSFGWFARTSSSTELIAAFTCQHCDS